MAIKLPKLSKKTLAIIIAVVAVIVIVAFISMIAALISDTNRLEYQLITNEYIQKLESNANGEKYPYLYNQVGTYAVVDIKSTYRGGLFAKRTLTIPAQYKGKAVSSIISLQSLQRTKNLVISDGIVNIGNSAFAQGGFVNCQIPDSVTYIGTSAFLRCTALETLTLPPHVTSIADGTFNGCSSLKNIIIPDSVTSVGTNAFANCSKLNFTVENGAKYLGTSANSHYVLVEKESADITACTINANTVIIAGGAFSGAEKLENISIPNNVTTWGNNVFDGCKALTGVTLGTGLTDIPTYAFNGCVALQSIVIPSNIKTINDYAFNGCSELTSVTMNVGLEKLNAAIFANCTNLTTITFNGEKAQWLDISKRETGNSAWNRRSSITTIDCIDEDIDLTTGQ